jgi:competence protein ComEA
MKAPSRLFRTGALLFSLLALPASLAAAQRAPAPQPAAKAAPATKAAPAAKSSAASSASSAPTSPVNVNSASVDDLVRLPGIGPARAQAIVEMRSKLGGFKKLEDLMRVKGIGRATFRKLEALMKL